MVKIAATFTVLKSDLSLHLALRQDVRSRSLNYAPQEKRRYFAQLLGYQVMPDDKLFDFQTVELRTPAVQLISHQDVRAISLYCGEEIINEREVRVNSLVYCQTCARGGYYRVK